MYTLHPTLLIGPSDWRADVMPKEEFLRRIEALWQAAPAASHAIVFGSPAHHAELAYFTNLVPKLEVAAALLTRSGEHRLFVGGGANMLAAARPLSFIDTMAPLNGLGPALKPIAANSPILLIGGGYMTAALRRSVDDALGTYPENATAQAWTLMRRKSPYERAAVQEACEALTAAVSVMRGEQQSGAGATDVLLAGERTASQVGAQEVRTLFSANRGRTLMPFTAPMRDAIDPLQVYVAVRAFNYWAEGFVPLSPRTSPAADKTASVLRDTLATIKAGTRLDEIRSMIAAASAPYKTHPVATGIADAIGLALEERPHTGVGEVFQSGEIYSLKVGLSDDLEQHAIMSAMIAVNGTDVQVLWQTPGSIAEPR